MTALGVGTLAAPSGTSPVVHRRTRGTTSDRRDGGCLGVFVLTVYIFPCCLQTSLMGFFGQKVNHRYYLQTVKEPPHISNAKQDPSRLKQ